MLLLLRKKSFKAFTGRSYSHIQVSSIVHDALRLKLEIVPNLKGFLFTHLHFLNKIVPFFVKCV